MMEPTNVALLRRQRIRALLAFMLWSFPLLLPIRATAVKVIGSLFALVGQIPHAPVIERGSFFHDAVEALESLDHAIEAFGVGNGCQGRRLINEVIIVKIPK